MERKNINEKERETMDLFINGYIFTLIKGRKDQIGVIKKPCFMGKYGWALKEIIKLKRTR